MMIPKLTSSIVLVTDTVRHCPIVSPGCDRPLGGGPPAARGPPTASGCQLPAIMLQSKVRFLSDAPIWSER